MELLVKNTMNYMAAYQTTEFGGPGERVMKVRSVIGRDENGTVFIANKDHLSRTEEVTWQEVSNEMLDRIRKDFNNSVYYDRDNVAAVLGI